MKLEIVNRSSARVPRAFLEAWVRAFDRELGRKISPKKFREKSLVIAFVGAAEMRKLNREFRGKDKTTDVLSFESDERDTLGELAICPEVITKQAREHGLLVKEELGYMVIHGVLHLLGYDHEDGGRRARSMFSLQDSLFEKLLSKKLG